MGQEVQQRSKAKFEKKGGKKIKALEYNKYNIDDLLKINKKNINNPIVKA